MACEADLTWTAETKTEETPPKPVSVVTCEDIETENLKRVTKDETGDALALLIVMFSLSTLS